MTNRDNTAKLAQALWASESIAFDPVEFQARFDAIYAASDGIATLWRLGGAANDYLHHHPGSIQVPHELAPTLLRSRLVDGRIIGLKLLVRCSSDIEIISPWVLAALESNHDGVLYGGLLELDNRPKFAQAVTQEVQPAKPDDRGLGAAAIDCGNLAGNQILE